MLVFSKMKKLLKNNNLLQMYNFIPDELKEEFHRRSQDFIKQNSLEAWKDFLKSWYKKEDASTPKGIGDYFESMFRHMRDVNKKLPNKKKWYYGKKKIERKSNFGGYSVRGPMRIMLDRLLAQDPDDGWEAPEVERQVERDMEIIRQRIERERRERRAVNLERFFQTNELIGNILRNINPRQFGKKKIKRKSKMIKKVPESLKKKCRKLKVRLTVKRGKKRVYKSEKVLKKQCKTAMKKKKKVVKRKRKFGRPARHGGIIVPQMSNGFGRPYFGYTVGGKVRFGSRRPEFHYPEHVLKGYNTAKTNKKFRFGRPHRHPLRYAHYNPSKTGKKYRFR